MGFDLRDVQKLDDIVTLENEFIDFVRIMLEPDRGLG